MSPILQRSRPDDAELARRVFAGDASAFAALDERHRKPLIRYARTLLRRSEHDAEDVVQDVLIRAHDALRAGGGPGELRPWLYRLVRNRAIDEVRRARWGDEALGDEALLAGDERADPEAMLRRKESIRRLVDDLADLPLRQRTALLAREVDGQSAATVGVVCKRPDANGSIAEDPRVSRPGEQASRVCDARAVLYRKPGRMFVATVFRDQPLSILRRDSSGAWALVISDVRSGGWIKTSALCG